VAVHGGHHGLARIRSLLKVRLGWNIQLDVYCVEFESPCSDFRTYCWGFEIPSNAPEQVIPDRLQSNFACGVSGFMTGDFDASASLPDSSDVIDPFLLMEYRRDPRRAITEDGVICLICGHSFRHLTNTHLRKHDLTSDEYKQQFGYNMRRALMTATSRRTHTENARKLGLASRIRRRRILDDVELKRMGGRHRHSLEELLTRQERPSRFTRQNLRDQQGRFAASLSQASLQITKTEDRPMSSYTLTINGKTVRTGEVPADMPLLSLHAQQRGQRDGGQRGGSQHIAHGSRLFPQSHHFIFPSRQT
jgi:hypothetical protein